MTTDIQHKPAPPLEQGSTSTDPTPHIERGSVVTVQRRRTRTPGAGLLKGLGVVFHHWHKSFEKLDDYEKTAGTFTTEYPEERLPLPEAYRNMPILLYDDATGHELCTSCFQCQRICPPQVIHMTQAKDPQTGKAIPAVAEFIIEYDACMSCGFCAEVCPFDAIKMDHHFELSTADHTTLTVHKEGLLRPVSYYQAIAPTFWAEAQESAYKKLQGNIKRRPALVGIAPQVVEKIRAAQDTAHDTDEGTATTLATPQAAPLDAGVETTDPAADKATRLAAIRARNKTKRVEGEQPAAEGVSTPAAQAPEASMDSGGDLPSDKQARLAAIRARNRAQQAEQGEE
ncbi:MAG: 4Fe-4S binding protein [Chloroflexaceae bacterium]|nr:4Fe-4S binding protein [Chloroflexaceae bacterium]